MPAGKRSAKNKAKLASGSVRARALSVSRGRAVLPSADSLGISGEHIVGREMTRGVGLVGESLNTARSLRLNRKKILHQPLVSYRASFWIGVGFGALVVGILAILAWELLRVDTLEAIVVSLSL